MTLHGVSLPQYSVPIFDLTLTATATNIDTGAIIPQSFSILDIFLITRSDEAATSSTTQGFQFNNDTSSIYDRELVRGGNSTVSHTSSYAQNNIAVAIAGGSHAANVFSYFEGTIPFYSKTNAHKIMSYRSGIPDTADGALPRVDTAWGRWRSTAAITRIAFTRTAGAYNFVAGTQLLIYAR